MGLNDDVTWVWPNMVNLNVMDFSKWYEWDGLWSEGNEWDGLRSEGNEWGGLHWNVINEIVNVTREELKSSGCVIICYKPIIEHRYSIVKHSTIKSQSHLEVLSVFCFLAINCHYYNNYYYQRIPESSYTRKGTVAIEILITSMGKGDRKIMQPIRITSETATRMRKWNQFSQFIYQSNSYRKDLSWLHFDYDPRVLRDATSEGPIHTIWCYIIILDDIAPNSDFY